MAARNSSSTSTPTAKVFVVGVPGKAYTLDVDNNNVTVNRIEVVTTVDGKNTLTSESSDEQSSGTVISRSHEFAGWQRAGEQTATPFIFGQAGSSIAAAGSTGVIGFAAYRELCVSAGIIGTPDRVGGTFVRHGVPDTLEINYATEEWLREHEIIPQAQ